MSSLRLGNLFIAILVSVLSFSVIAHGSHGEGQEITIPNFKHGSGEVWVGGQPSENDLKLLAERGIKNIINLRGVGEFDGFDEKATAENLSLNYKALPLGGKSAVSVEAATQFAAMLNESQGKTLVHCASGNRVGAMFALKAFFVDKKTATEAMEIGKKHGMTRLEAHVKSLIDKEI